MTMSMSIFRRKNYPDDRMTMMIPMLKQGSLLMW